MGGFKVDSPERDKFIHLILSHWELKSVPFYLAEILCGDATIEETIKDLKSFEKK